MASIERKSRKQLTTQPTRKYKCFGVVIIENKSSRCDELTATAKPELKAREGAAVAQMTLYSSVAFRPIVLLVTDGLLQRRDNFGRELQVESRLVGKGNDQPEKNHSWWFVVRDESEGFSDIEAVCTNLSILIVADSDDLLREPFHGIGTNWYVSLAWCLYKADGKCLRGDTYYRRHMLIFVSSYKRPTMHKTGLEASSAVDTRAVLDCKLPG